jgi:hypothetical protein
LEKKEHKQSKFNFLSPTLLVKDNDDTLEKMQGCGLGLVQEGLFNPQWEAYSFKQCLIGNNNRNLLNCILIDEDIIFGTNVMAIR